MTTQAEYQGAWVIPNLSDIKECIKAIPHENLVYFRNIPHNHEDAELVTIRNAMLQFTSELSAGGAHFDIDRVTNTRYLKAIVTYYLAWFLFYTRDNIKESPTYGDTYLVEDILLDVGPFAVRPELFEEMYPNPEAIKLLQKRLQEYCLLYSVDPL
jgi:hypothetical protein